MPADEVLRVSAYVAPMAFIWGLYWSRRVSMQRRSLRVREAARQAGLTEPPSLHPVIDPVHCIGCQSCLKACPEGDILGIVDGKAELINPTHCIGHGACKEACPTDAIELVFGSERRGVDIPVVSETFETNVPGIFLAGELGGMGLIRNAIEQGRHAMEAIGKVAGANGRNGGPGSTSWSSAPVLRASRPRWRRWSAGCASSPSSRIPSAARWRTTRGARS